MVVSRLIIFKNNEKSKLNTPFLAPKKARRHKNQYSGYLNENLGLKRLQQGNKKQITENKRISSKGRWKKKEKSDVENCARVKTQIKLVITFPELTAEKMAKLLKSKAFCAFKVYVIVSSKFYFTNYYILDFFQRSCILNSEQWIIDLLLTIY